LIIILLEGPCLKQLSTTKISALEIDKSDILDLLSELRISGKYLPQSSINLFLSTYSRLPRILSLFRKLDPSTSIYFLTPIGVFHENDLAIGYYECFSEMPSNQIKELLVKFGAYEKIYDLLEQDFDLCVICMTNKLIRLLELNYYLPANRPSIIVSNAYSSEKNNVYTITQTHFFTSRLRRVFEKISLPDLYQHALGYIAKALIDLVDRGYKLKYLYENPKDLYRAIFSSGMLDKFLSIKRRQDKILKFI